MPRTTSYAYDLHGNLVQKALPNGETVAQSFDALNRVSIIEGQKPNNGGLLYRYSQRYDLAGNVVFLHEDYRETAPARWREVTQSYDGAHRLVWEEYRHSEAGIFGTSDSDRDVVYTYDAADNRTSKETHYLSPDRETCTYNALNQLTRLEATQHDRPSQAASSRTVDFGYDLNGSRTSRVEDTATTAYQFDYEQRMIGMTVSTLQSSAYNTYTYDYRTRRVVIASNLSAGEVATITTTTTLSFSGGTSVQEYTQLSTDNPQLSVEYIRGSDLGGGIGGILYSLRDDQPSFTHYNARGDVAAKTDGGSTLTYQAAYEAFGTRSEETGSTLDRQKANTKDEDPTGMLNEGLRYRDLETGVFITRDPAGFVDGPNLYTYVRQNPWTKFDPEGLEANIPKYPTTDQAAVEGMRDMQTFSEKPGNKSWHDVEWSQRYFQDPKTKKHGYTNSRTDNDPGNVRFTGPETRLPEGTTESGIGHSHTEGGSNTSFSRYSKEGGDTQAADAKGVPVYLITRDAYGNEVIRKYTPLPGAKDDPSKQDKGQMSDYDPVTQTFRAIPPQAPGATTGKPELIGVGQAPDGTRGAKWRYPDGSEAYTKNVNEPPPTRPSKPEAPAKPNAPSTPTPQPPPKKKSE